VKINKNIKSQDLLKKNLMHATMQQTDILPKNICKLQVEIELSTLLFGRISSVSLPPLLLAVIFTLICCCKTVCIILS
jgi:hypothetical protein